MESIDTTIESELTLLRSTERITDWFGPWNERLSAASGKPIPNGGSFDQFRDEWSDLDVTPGTDSKSLQTIALEVARIFVPRTVQLSGSITSEFVDYNVRLDFTDLTDFELCFPTQANTQIINRPKMLAWAAFALTDSNLGFAVFASQERGDNQSVNVTIEPVKHALAHNLRKGA